MVALQYLYGLQNCIYALLLYKLPKSFKNVKLIFKIKILFIFKITHEKTFVSFRSKIVSFKLLENY